MQHSGVILGCMAKKLMSALQEYATPSSAKWLHGETVDVCIATSIQHPVVLLGRMANKLMLALQEYATPSSATRLATRLHGEKVDVSITQVCCTQYADVCTTRVCEHCKRLLYFFSRAVQCSHLSCDLSYVLQCSHALARVAVLRAPSYH